MHTLHGGRKSERKRGGKALFRKKYVSTWEPFELKTQMDVKRIRNMRPVDPRGEVPFTHLEMCEEKGIGTGEKRTL